MGMGLSKCEGKGKKLRQRLERNQVFVILLVCVCVTQKKVDFIQLNLYLPERLLHLIWGRSEERKKEIKQQGLVTMWERTANEYC